MVGMSRGTIGDRVNRRGMVLKTAEILTSKGFRSVGLIDEDTILDWVYEDRIVSSLISRAVRNPASVGISEI